MNSIRAKSIASLIVALLLGEAAVSGSHLWRIHELYSNADGTIQFIEFREILGSQNEWHLEGRWFQTDSHYYEFPNDLDGPTALKKFLMATASYAAQPDVPAPDYIVPDNFFDPAGDSLIWFTYDTFEVIAGELPVDGVHSLDRQSLAAGINSPTNFDAVTGRVLDPASDYDADTVPDPADNCLLVSNADQRDTNGDGYGNLCDADLDNDGFVNFTDLALLKAVFFGDDADADLDGSGAVNFVDLGIAKEAFFQPPGPSGSQ